MVALEGDRKLVLSDYDYLRDEATAAAFERRAAAHAREVGAIEPAAATRRAGSLVAVDLNADPGEVQAAFDLIARHSLTGEP